MAFDDFAANRESCTGAAVFVFVVEPLKHLENAIVKHVFDADSVVFDGKLPSFVLFVSGGHDDMGWRLAIVFLVFESVCDQVLKDAAELAMIPCDGGHRTDIESGIGLFE
jgi:hypothetical protein